MKTVDLRAAIEEFQANLIAHRKLWGDSLNSMIPSHPEKNHEELQEQTRWLSRKLGTLRPYFERFSKEWLMQHPATGVVWDVLDAATGLEAVAQKKGPSLRTVEERLNQILGELDTYDDDDEIPRDSSQPIASGIGLDKLMHAYLPQLHPFIADGCTKLFMDGHYTQAVEEAAKAVFQYTRDATGLSLDGSALIDNAFSPKNPILAFSDMEDETKRNEQIGFMEMVKGFGKGVRNPLTHTHGKQEEAHKAFEYLVMASLFCRRIDDAKPEV